MTIHFIEAEIDLHSAPLSLNQKVEEVLADHGEPLRWALTRVDSQTQTVHLEAVVTTP